MRSLIIILSVFASAAASHKSSCVSTPTTARISTSSTVKPAPNCLPTLTTVSGRFAPTGQVCSGQLLLNEQFDSLNNSLWNHEIRLGGFNGEFHWYTDAVENSFTQNGILNLQPTQTIEVIPDLTKCQISLVGCTGSGNACSRTCSPTNIALPVRSAQIRTDGNFNFKYGRIVMRAKMPSGQWLWPAIWMMPIDSVYGGWPLSGEIDVVETRGNDHLINSQGVNFGAEQYGTTLHFGTTGNVDFFALTNTRTQTAVPGQGFDAAFHVYEMDWTPDHIQLRMDGVLKVNYTTGAGYFKLGGFTGTNPWASGGLDAPFDQEFYLIMNNAVGGTNGYFPDGLDNKPWKNSDGAQAKGNFWNGRASWLPTWNTDVTAVRTSALQVDYLQLYAL